MKVEELEKNKELFEQVQKKILALKEQGKSDLEATVAAFRDQGIEFDEDALRAKAVEKIPLDNDVLNAVAGGGSCSNLDWCAVNHACWTAVHHNSNSDPRKTPCFSNNFCYGAYHRCDKIYYCTISYQATCWNAEQ